MDKQYVLLGGISAIVVIFIIIGMVVMLYNKNKMYIGNGFKIDTLNSYSSSITPNENIAPPKLESNFTISFWIYINDFYENHLYWKHMFHKGTLNTGLYNYKYWYNIETETPQQCLGLWMHPTSNDLRVAITTVVDTQHKNSEHPIYEVASLTKEKNVYKENIETCDILDIPSKTMVNIIICVEGQTLSIYRDGKLHKTCGLNGAPLLNVGDMYFNNQRTYSGKLANFMYFPSKISKNKIRQIYNDKP
jgi:hypothetical protein